MNERGSDRSFEDDVAGATAPRAHPAADPEFLRFGFRFDAKYRLAALVFGVRPEHTWVTVDRRAGGVLGARFGLWFVETPLANVLRAEATGPYALIKTIGPPHVSLVDQGLTFASNGDAGVCIRFREPVPGVEPLGVVRHPALTVTVADVDGLLAALR